jgi:ubiquinone biosynthesis protein
LLKDPPAVEIWLTRRLPTVEDSLKAGVIFLHLFSSRDRSIFTEDSMGIALKGQHLKRYKDITRLFVKYGRDTAEPTDILTEDQEEQKDASRKGRELTADLERLGPTFVKIGQLLSTRADLLPIAYLEQLSRLQDDVAPFAFDQVEEVIFEELGTRVSKVFREFTPQPIAAASLGQVHVAVLHDGQRVAVKVQRPGIRRTMARDFESLERIADVLDSHSKWSERYEFRKIVDDFRRTLVRELDYRQEAHNLKVIGERTERFDKIVIPKGIEEYTTSRVLTMQFIHGRKVTELSEIDRKVLNGHELADQLLRAYLEQTLVDGFFHADPHPGNVFVTAEGKVALIDLGMVGRIAPRLREQLLKLLIAISHGRGEEVAEHALRIGDVRKNFKEKELVRRVTIEVNEHQGRRMEDLQMGKIVMEITAIASDCGIRVPSELTLLGKTLMNLDEVGRALDPEFDPNAAVRRHAGEIMNRQLLRSLSPGNLFEGVLETREMLSRLPHNVNRILEDLSHNRAKIRVSAIDEEYLMEGFQKIANRITTGVVLAGTVVGASLLTRVETDFEIFGYPGLAILFFLAAALGGLALLGDIIFRDQHHHKKVPWEGEEDS